MRKTVRPKEVTAILPLLIVIALGTGVSSVSAAEPEAEEPSAEMPEKQQPKKPGFYTDDFHILPELQLTAYYDDNIYATRQAEESDYIAIVSPTLKINSRWAQHSLKLDAGANIGRYQDNSTEDYEDLWIEAKGNYQVSSATNLFAGAGYNKKHEGRDSKDSSQTADEPTTYEVQNLQLGGRYSLQDYVIRLGVTYEKLDFDNVGDLFNDDRDRTHSALGLRVTRGLGNRTKIYAQGLLNQRVYELELDDTNRDSSGYSAVLGLIRNFGKKDRLEAYAGVLSQDYDDADFETVTAADFGLNLRWHPAESYKVIGSLNRTLGETTEEGASGYLLTKLNLQLEKKLYTDYVGYVGYTYGLYDYQEIDREDLYNAVTLGLNYYMNRHILISGSYSYYDNDSNDEVLDIIPGESYDYRKNLFLLSVKARLAP